MPLGGYKDVHKTVIGMTLEIGCSEIVRVIYRDRRGKPVHGMCHLMHRKGIVTEDTEILVLSIVCSPKLTPYRLLPRRSSGDRFTRNEYCIIFIVTLFNDYRLMYGDIRIVIHITNNCNNYI